jgi:hypothetical protein
MTVGMMKCWICGDSAPLTGEHRTKRSDLKAVFGEPSQKQPLFLHDVNRKNRRVGSLNAAILKTSAGLCGHCNNARTQPHDQAWQALSAALRVRLPTIGVGGSLRATTVFRYDTARQMFNVHLYFLKLFGGQIVDQGIAMDVAQFGRSIVDDRAHPNIYLKFGHGAGLSGAPMTGISHMRVAIDPSNDSIACAVWFYCVAPFAVQVMFAVDGEPWPGLKGSWHPRHGTGKLLIADFRSLPLSPLSANRGDPGPWPVRD